MTFTPPWLPWDWQSQAVVAAGFVVLCIGLLAWTAACLRVALRGDWLSAVALQAGATAVAWSVLCGRQILPMARRPWVTTYYWAGFEWTHREFTVFARDGLVWMAAGACLLVAALGLVAVAPRLMMTEDGGGAP